MDDTISRQAALDAFGLSEKTRKYGGDHSGYDTRMLYEIQDVLEGLPSAQPETHEERTETHACDLISRQAAIEAFYKHPNVDWTTLDVIAELKAIPSAQTVMSDYSDKLWRAAYERGKAEAERKKGKWSITNAYPHNVYCSECHARFAQTHWEVWEDGSLPRNYCPNCGADMRGDL